MPSSSIILSLLAFGLCSQSADAAPYEARKDSKALSRSDHSVQMKVTSSNGIPPLGPRQKSQRRDWSDPASNDETITLLLYKQQYSVPVTIGSQTFELLVDTGSSDTWIADEYFSCEYSQVFGTASQSYCALGDTFHHKPGETLVSPVENVHFDVAYGDGSGAWGPMVNAYTNLSDGLSFYQEVGLASQITWDNGNNITSGILGLGFSGVTNKFPGTDITLDRRCFWNSTTVRQSWDRNYTCNSIRYDGIIKNLDSFSLAMSRDSAYNYNGGVLTYNGIPDLSKSSINASDSFTTVPAQSPSYDDTGTLRLWMISVDGLTLPVSYNVTAATATTTSSRSFSTGNAAAKRMIYAASHRSKHDTIRRSSASASTGFHAMSASSSDGSAQFIVDSGSEVNYLPAPLAAAYNSLFIPAAVYEYGFYMLNCSTISYIPPFALSIGGETFHVNPKDMVVRHNETLSSGKEYEYCFSAVQEAEQSVYEGTTVNLLGAAFLKSVFAVFDVENEEMSFSARPYYES